MVPRSGSGDVTSPPVRDEIEPYSQPARNVPSELAVLLAEVQRLQAELVAARATVKELEATADIDAVTVGLTTDEREDISRLRRKDRVLREERDIL